MSIYNKASVRDLEDMEKRMEKRLIKKLIWTGIFVCVGTVLLNALTDRIAESL